MLDFFQFSNLYLMMTNAKKRESFFVNRFENVKIAFSH